MKKQILIGISIVVVILGAMGVFWFLSSEHLEEKHFAECRKGETYEKLQCWERKLISLLDTEGVVPAFEALAYLYSTEPEFAPDCHGYTHIIGEEAYDIFSRTQAVGLAPQVSYCGYGFFHGFMETLLHTTGDYEEARQFCAYIDKYPDQIRSSGGSSACYHGIGHGFIDGSDPSLWGSPEEMAKPGLELCEDVGETDFQKYLCVTGIFNSLEQLSIEDEKYGLLELQTDPYTFCARQNEAHQEACYTNMLPAVLRLTDNNFEEALHYIQAGITKPDLPTIEDRTTLEMVVLSLAHEFIRVHLNEPLAITEGVGFCRSLKDEKIRGACIAGLGGGYMKYGAPNTAHEKSLSFCVSSLLHDEGRKYCYGYVLPRLGLWYDDSKVREICGEVPTAFRHFCSI